jgi:hypothetical protein
VLRNDEGLDEHPPLQVLMLSACAACVNDPPGWEPGWERSAGFSANDDGDAALEGTAEKPPIGDGNVVPRLTTGQYLDLHGEGAVHALHGPSGQTIFDRVCSNDVLGSAAADGMGGRDFAYTPVPESSRVAVALAAARSGWTVRTRRRLEKR